MGNLAVGLIFYTAILISAVLLISFRYLPRFSALATLAALASWLGYVGLLSYLRVPAFNLGVPPGLSVLLVPVFTFVLVVGLSPAGRALAVAIPLWILVGFEVFRVGVEIVLAELHAGGLTPEIMTLQSGNVEILFAATAPIAAFFAYRAKDRPRWIIAWSVLGLVSLANVAARAVLTVPGTLNLISADVPDRAITMPPFTLIPGFMAPLALLLHVLSIRSLLIWRIGRE